MEKGRISHRAQVTPDWSGGRRLDKALRLRSLRPTSDPRDAGALFRTAIPVVSLIGSSRATMPWAARGSDECPCEANG